MLSRSEISGRGMKIPRSKWFTLYIGCGFYLVTLIIFIYASALVLGLESGYIFCLDPSIGSWGLDSIVGD